MPVFQKISSVFNAKSLRGGAGGMLLAASLPMTGMAEAPPAPDYTPAQVEALSGWRADFRTQCLMPGDEVTATPAAARIRQTLAALVAQGAIGAQLAQTLADLKTPVCLDPHAGRIDGFYADTWNTVFLKESNPLPKTLLVLFHETRHAMQKTQGLIGSINTGMADAVKLTYAVEADAVAIATLAAWHMKQAGDDSVWNMMKQEQLYGDIPPVFESVLQNGGTETAATMAAFEQWYQSPIRIQAYMQETMRSYHAARAARRDLPYHDSLPAGYFDRLGEMRDGSNYGAKDSPRLRQGAFSANSFIVQP